MACTKQIAKKTGLAKAPKKVFNGSRKSLPLPKKVTVRRFSQGVWCLREIRKEMKALNLAIPKLPFQRLCREICDERKIGVRWQRIALEYLQEAAEDFLIEFFQESYICAAHAKRVTLMEKDFIVLRRLRFRYSKLLDPLPIRDEKTYNILNIPPYRKPKPSEEVKIEEVTHERDTRQARKAGLQKEEHNDVVRTEENARTQIEEKNRLVEIEAELPSLLNSLNPLGFIVRAFLERDLGNREDYISLDKECMIILKDKGKELNDTLVLATLR